jgi:hypothetical protein
MAFPRDAPDGAYCGENNLPPAVLFDGVRGRQMERANTAGYIEKEDEWEIHASLAAPEAGDDGGQVERSHTQAPACLEDCNYHY